MKKILKLTALTLAVSALAVSCAKEASAPVAEPQAAGTRTFTLTFANPDSKVSISDQGKTAWKVGDEILVHGEYTGENKSKVVTLTAEDISADGKVATITVEGVTPYERPTKYLSTYYAAYPASAVKDNDHCYYYTDFTTTKAPLMAAYNDGDNFVFYNLTGLISFSAEGDFDTVKFQGNANEVVGYEFFRTYLALNLDRSPRLDYSYTSDGGTSGPLTVYEAAFAAGTNYICLPVGANFTSGFTFYFYKGENIVKVAKTVNPVEIPRSSILALGDITSKLEDFVAPETSDHKSAIPTEGAIDLAADGTQANCYIVSAPGTYKFAALKGNSAEAPGHVFGVQLLWETNNNDTTPEAGSVIAAVDFEDDVIYFQTPETLKSGNALIAAKDFEGNIIWSWHIWIPATEIVIQNGAALVGAKIMDRNLGALTAMSMTADPDPLSIGLNYQWGRKDPFPGNVSFTSNTAAAVAGTAWSSKGEHITTAYSIAHPTEYAHIPSVDAGVWNVDDPQDLWNGAENAKTIYDPCPAGYRVPLYDSSLPMWKGAFDESWTVDAANYRFAYGDITFPVGGYIDCWSPGHEKTGLRTHIWASKWYDAERATCLYYREGAFYAQKFHKAKAGSVRCVKETADEPATVPATSVELDQTVLNLTVGGEATLTATVLPVETTDELEWSSSDEAVATVAAGKVTAIAAGTATITAKAGDKSATCAVTVTAAAPVASGWVKTALADLKDGDVIVLASEKSSTVYAMSNSNGTTKAPATVELTVSDDTISDPAETIQFTVKITVESNETHLSFYKDEENAVYVTNTNNGVRVGSGSANLFIIDEESNYLKDITWGRYIGVYNSADWRCYTSVNANITGQSFYAFVKPAE